MMGMRAALACAIVLTNRSALQLGLLAAEWELILHNLQQIAPTQHIPQELEEMILSVEGTFQHAFTTAAVPFERRKRAIRSLMYQWITAFRDLLAVQNLFFLLLHCNAHT